MFATRKLVMTEIPLSIFFNWSYFYSSFTEKNINQFNAWSLIIAWSCSSLIHNYAFITDICTNSQTYCDEFAHIVNSTLKEPTKRRKTHKRFIQYNLFYFFYILFFGYVTACLMYNRIYSFFKYLFSNCCQCIV